MNDIENRLRCEDVRRWLDAELDGELDVGRAEALSVHVEVCADCRAQQEAAQALRHALRERLPYHRAPQALHARLAMLAVPAATPVRKPSRVDQVRRWALPLAAGLMLGVVIEYGYGRWHAQAQTELAMMDAVSAAHLRSLQAGHLADVASTDQHTVKPWFAGRLDYSPPVQDYAAQGYALIGGRLDYLDHRAVAALVYQRRKHLINVFVWPDAAASTAHADTQAGYNFIAWGDGAMRWWIVSDLNAAELAAFAGMLRGEAPGKS